jgi:hypothetical protein
MIGLGQKPKLIQNSLGQFIPEKDRPLPKSSQPESDLPSSLAQDKITFDTDFESANCDSVKRISASEYHVFIRNDTNSKGPLQWFYFCMRNTTDYVGVVKIKIVNFTKKDSLFHKVSNPPGSNF